MFEIKNEKFEIKNEAETVGYFIAISEDDNPPGGGGLMTQRRAAIRHIIIKA